jgi:hypothetical protein
MGKQGEIKMNETVKISATHKGVFSALAAAQLQMGPALKDSSNPAFKSKYADLSSVMAACLPALNSNGIAVFQPTGEDEAGRFVRTILAHESGETIDCRVPLIVSKNDMQGYGSAVTYARRYGLMSMAGIAPEDDDGNAAAKAAPDPRAEFEADVAQAVRGIGREETMESLGALWGDLTKRQRAVAEDARVIKAKDAKKAELAPKRADIDDEIPY